MEAGTQRTREELIGDFTELGERFAALDRNYTREQLLWRPEAAKAGVWPSVLSMSHWQMLLT